MPINIYNDDTLEKIDYICDGNWELPKQIDIFESWLKENENKFPKSNYVADVGFEIRKDACGGGAVLSTKSMSIMVNLNMELFLSEYPSDGELNV